MDLPEDLFLGLSNISLMGNREIYITELNEELTAPKEGGLHRMAIKDTGDVILGYEGAHFYKINGKYYLFFIHWPRGGYRTEACFCADSLLGEFTGGDVLSYDLMRKTCVKTSEY